MSQCSEDEHDKEIAQNATGLWNSEENKIDEYFKVTCIKNVASNLAGGMVYTINLSIGQTDCALSDKLTLEDVDECDLKSGGQTLDCEFEVFEEFQSEDPYKLNSAKCQDQSTQVEPTDDNTDDEDSNDVKDGKEEENSDDNEVLDVEKDKEDEDEDDNQDEDNTDDDKEDKADDEDENNDDKEDENEDENEDDKKDEDKGENEEEDKDEDDKENDKEEDKDDDIDDN